MGAVLFDLSGIVGGGCSRRLMASTGGNEKATLAMISKKGCLC